MWPRYSAAFGTNEPERGRVYAMPLNMDELHVLDLTRDPNWSSYLPSLESFREVSPSNNSSANKIQHMKALFREFLKKNSIDLNNYGAVIGPNFVYGGKQLCILYRNGKPSPIQAKVWSSARPDLPGWQAGTGYARNHSRALCKLNTGTVTIDTIPTVNSNIRRMAANQLGVAVLGQLLGEAILAIRAGGVQRQVEENLKTKKKDAIATYLSRGQGVLVIVSLKVWKYQNFNYQKSTNLIHVYIQPGVTPNEAIRNWYKTPRYIKGPPEGWDRTERFAWIVPYAEMIRMEMGIRWRPSGRSMTRLWERILLEDVPPPKSHGGRPRARSSSSLRYRAAGARQGPGPCGEQGSGRARPGRPICGRTARRCSRGWSGPGSRCLAPCRETRRPGWPSTVSSPARRTGLSEGTSATVRRQRQQASRMADQAAAAPSASEVCSGWRPWTRRPHFGHRATGTRKRVV